MNIREISTWQLLDAMGPHSTLAQAHELRLLLNLSGWRDTDIDDIPYEVWWDFMEMAKAAAEVRKESILEPDTAQESGAA